MDEATYLLIFVLAFNGIFDAVVVAWLAGRRSKNALINALSNPDDEVKAALHSISQYLIDDLWKSMNTPSIEFPGPPTKEGLPTAEKLTPIHAVIRDGITAAKNEISTAVAQKLWGMDGVVTKQANQMLEAGGIPRKRRKGEPLGEYLQEQLANRVMPKVAEMVDQEVNKKIGQGIKEVKDQFT